MKHFALICLIASFGLAFIYKPNVTLDTYKVIKVTGNIIYKKNNKDVIQGDLFPENEQIVFKTVDSKAAIISTAKGRFILAPGADKNAQVKLERLRNFFNESLKKEIFVNWN